MFAIMEALSHPVLKPLVAKLMSETKFEQREVTGKEAVNSALWELEKAIEAGGVVTEMRAVVNGKPTLMLSVISAEPS